MAHPLLRLLRLPPLRPLFFLLLPLQGLPLHLLLQLAKRLQPLPRVLPHVGLLLPRGFQGGIQEIGLLVVEAAELVLQPGGFLEGFLLGGLDREN